MEANFEIKKIAPSAAFVVYGDDYIESHKITPDGKFGPGKPLSFVGAKSLLSIAENLKVGSTLSVKGVIPKNLLYIDTNPLNIRIIWITESIEKKLFFKEVRGKAGVPALLWNYSGGSLSMYALKTINPNILKSKLYESPFPNLIGSRGGVCMGNVKINRTETNIERIMNSMENAFFNSYFTHGDNMEYWIESVKKNKPFDYSILKESNNYESINDFIDEIS